MVAFSSWLNKGEYRWCYADGLGIASCEPAFRAGRDFVKGLFVTPQDISFVFEAELATFVWLLKKLGSFNGIICG